MENKRIEIDGRSFDLDDPGDKKAAVRAWLRAKSRERNAREQAGVTEDGSPDGAMVVPVEEQAREV